jgi:hypothetical protein
MYLELVKTSPVITNQPERIQSIQDAAVELKKIQIEVA